MSEQSTASSETHRAADRAAEAADADARVCVGVCRLGADGVCVGCLRHIDEIVAAGLAR